ncbi:MAG: EamA family transporter [Candidatus Heimdallarchaeota archaeon]|nr:EamA family transporter [Candidatus Heimdallarchaeota archaeon]
MGNRPSSLSYGAMAIAILGWGLSTTFIEFGLEFVAPFPFLFYRFGLATLVLTPFVFYFRRSEFFELIKNKWTWAIGLAEASGLTLQYLGQETVPAGLAALLSLSFIIIVPFLSPIILNEKLEKNHLIAMSVAFIGVIFISTEGNVNNIMGSSFIGIILLLGAAVGYAFYIISTSRLTTIEKPDVDTFTLFYSVLLIITLASLVTSLTFSELSSVPSEGIQWIVLLTIFSTLIAFLAYFRGAQEISANVMSVLLPLQMLVPFTIDFFVLGRTYSLWVITGSVLVVLAMVIVVIQPYLGTPEKDSKVLIKVVES